MDAANLHHLAPGACHEFAKAAGDGLAMHPIGRAMAQLRAATLTIVIALAGYSAMTISLQAAGLKHKWDYATPGDLPQTVVRDVEGRPYLYAAIKNGGLLVLRLGQAKTGPQAVARLNTRAFSNLDVMNLVQRGEFLYLALGSFFSARGSKAGLAIVSVKNPRQPKVTSLWTSARKIRGSAIVETDGETAYLGAMSKGVFIFDVSNKQRIRELARILPDVHFPRANPGRVQHPNARGLAIKGSTLFVANDAGGLRVIDVSNKRRPREIGKYINQALPRKQQAYNNVVLEGSRAYVALDYCGLEILDISNPRDVRQLGWWNPWGCDRNSNLWFNSPGHTNQLVYDRTRHAVLLSAGDSEVLVVDVSDPARPRLTESFGRPKNKRGTWGVSASGDNIYLTYIKTFIPFSSRWSGIRALRWP